MNKRKLLTLMGGHITRFLMRDEFVTARAAGDVEGTNLEPLGGVRNVIDTENKLTISGNRLVFSGGKSSLAFADPAYYQPAVSRLAGRALWFEITGTTISGLLSHFGFADRKAASEVGLLIRQLSTSIVLRATNNSPVLTTVTEGVSYQCLLVLRAAGGFLYIKGGTEFPTWELVGLTQEDTTATLYPAISDYASVLSFDFYNILLGRWLQSPICSDGFSAAGTTDGAGHPETTGLGSGGSGYAWSDIIGTSGVSGGKWVTSALDGGVGLALLDTGLTSYHLYADLVVAGDTVGLIARYQDADNYISAVHNGTNLVVNKVVAGSATELISAAATYAANARLWIIANGTSFRFIYNNVLIGAAQTIADATLQTGTKAGIINGNVSNTVDNFVCYSNGKGGQLGDLVKFF